MESLDGNPSEMEAMQIRLRGNLRIQLEKTRQGLQKLEQSPQRLGEAAAALSTVISQCQRSETLIDGYDLIRTTSQVQGRFELVNRVYEELRDMDTRVERCVQLLEADMLVESKGGNVATSNYNYSASNPVQNAPGGTNLLLIYMHLSQMEAFRTRTLDMMRDAPSTTIYTLKRYFRKLDELSASFDRYFWERPMALLETARRAAEGVPGAASSILATAAVIYRLEMKRDVDSNSNFLYRDSSRFKNLIDRVIASKFENAIRKALGNDAQPGDDPSAALEAIEFWLEDLSLVRTQIVPQFLPSLNVMDIYTLTMHRHVHALVTLCLQGPSDLNKNGGKFKIFGQS